MRHRGRELLWVLLWFAALAVQAPASAADGFSFASRPAWVVPVEYPTDRLGDETRVRQGVHYLLADRQFRIDKDDVQYFIHGVYKIANRAGLDDWSSISINFDPSYEHILLIGVWIIRQGQKIDQLKTARIQVFQRERKLEIQSYDGQRTLNVLLQDVRVGDIVEFSLLLRGENPALRGLFYGYFDVAWNIPVDRFYRRVDWDKPGRTLHLRKVGNVGDPALIQSEGRQIYVWDRRDVDGVLDESDQPAWYEGYAGVELSDAEGWGSVARHARGLFESAVRATPELEAVARRIRAAHPQQEERAAAALRFVQDTIRYVAISIGRGGYVPNPAGLTLARRYGDCKDMTALLVSLLRLLDIEADAALVNTQTGRHLHERLPALPLFDHMITAARINGSIYWFDATLSDQAGDLRHLFQPDYGDALVLSDGADNLTVMPSGSSAVPTTSTYLDLDLSKGPQKPATMTVKTVYTGGDADRMRRQLSTQSLPELQRNYVEFYARYYADIRPAAALSVSRDDTLNRVTVTEFYELTQPWHERNGGWEALYDVGELRTEFDRPGAPDRTSPFKLRFPVYHEEMLTLHLPRNHTGWKDGKTTDHVADGAMSFDYESETSGSTTTFHYVYRTLQDNVPVSELVSYKADLDRALDWTGTYTVELAPKAPVKDKDEDRNRWVWLIVAAIYFGIVASRIRSRKVRKAATPSAIYHIHLPKS